MRKMKKVENSTQSFLEELGRMSLGEAESMGATQALMRVEPKPYRNDFIVMAARQAGRAEMMADIITLINKHFPETVDKTVKV